MLRAVIRSAALYGGAALSVVVRRVAVLICLYLLILVLAVVGLGFTTAAAWLALSQALGDVYASLIAGCTYLLVALIALLAVRAR